eukprot:5066891-Pyramimonas_sp.AAC.1
MEKHILHHFEAFTKFGHYVHTVAFVNGMKDNTRKLYDDFVQRLTDKADFMHPQLSNPIMTNNMHKLFIAIAADMFVNIYPKEMIDRVLLSALTLCYPQAT